MLNAIPVIGWLLNFILVVSLSIIFVPVWNYLAPTYFYFLPEVYLHIPFWHGVGLFMILDILQNFSPFRSHMEQSNKND